MYEGEPGERVMILISGRVKVTRLTDGGHDVLLSICDPGDLLGELSYLGGETRIATVTTLEPVELLTSPSSVFRAYVERSPHVAAALAAVIAQRLRGMTVTKTQFGTSDAMGRVAARLSELAERYGEQSERGLEISLALSQEDITAWTGASRSSTTHALQTFRELGWIQTHRRRIVILDLDALRTRAA